MDKSRSVLTIAQISSSKSYQHNQTIKSITKIKQGHYMQEHICKADEMRKYMNLQGKK
jgi:hypothetical protein